MQCDSLKEKDHDSRPTRDCQISDAAITGWYGRDRRESAASMKLSVENAKPGDLFPHPKKFGSVILATEMKRIIFLLLNESCCQYLARRACRWIQYNLRSLLPCFLGWR